MCGFLEDSSFPKNPYGLSMAGVRPSIAGVWGRTKPYLLVRVRILRVSRNSKIFPTHRVTHLFLRVVAP